MPARSFRMIFSVTSGCSAALAASYPASEMPPAFPRSLWQVAQYCATIFVCSAGAIDGAATRCAAAGAGPDGT